MNMMYGVPVGAALAMWAQFPGRRITASPSSLSIRPTHAFRDSRGEETAHRSDTA
jgi:hypothetical protein